MGLGCGGVRVPRIPALWKAEKGGSQIGENSFSKFKKKIEGWNIAPPVSFSSFLTKNKTKNKKPSNRKSSYLFEYNSKDPGSFFSNKT